MSLRSMLKLKDVREKFREYFPSPKIIPSGMLAPPLTTNYSSVGTAFDYLLRFDLQRRFPTAISKHWIANHAPNLLRENRDANKLAKLILSDAKKRHAQYLINGELTDGLLRACLFLAQLDPVFRAGITTVDIDRIKKADIADLRQLLSIVPRDILQPNYACLLDPTFGTASHFIRGADIDLVIDDMLIEIKTTKEATLQREHYNQVIGYYILYRLGGISGGSTHHELNKLGIYSSRYGKLHIFPLSSIATEEIFADFTNWFFARIRQLFGNDIKYVMLKDIK